MAGMALRAVRLGQEHKSSRYQLWNELLIGFWLDMESWDHYRYPPPDGPESHPCQQTRIV